MPAEFSASHDENPQRPRLVQDGPAHPRGPPLPIMPSSQTSSSLRDGHQGQQQEQQQQQQKPHPQQPQGPGASTLSSRRSSADLEPEDEFCPDPRLATAAAAAAALRRSSQSGYAPPTTTTGAASVPDNAVTSYQRLVKRYRVEVAASASSVLSTLTTFPLDSVKTRMQTYRYAGFIDCVRRTYRTEKLRGFFRGVTAPMASITLVRTVSFSIYQRSKYVYCDWVKKQFGVDVMAHVTSPGTYPNLWSIATFGAAGATAGSCITVIACEWF
jgi:hypothetical protein